MLEKQNNIPSKYRDTPYELETIRTFVGKNNDYFINKWEQSNDPDTKAGWNWAGFLTGLFWLGYRKMYKLLFIYFGAFIVIDIVQILLNIDVNSAVGAAISASIGGFGNGFYHKHMIAKLDKMTFDNNGQQPTPEEIAKTGGASWGGVGITFLMFIGYIIISTAIEMAFMFI